MKLLLILGDDLSGFLGENATSRISALMEDSKTTAVDINKWQYLSSAAWNK